jgi:hypothetical protein
VQRYGFKNFKCGVVEVFRRRHTLQIVTADLQTANVDFFQEKSNYPDFLHIRMARRPN